MMFWWTVNFHDLVGLSWPNVLLLLLHFFKIDQSDNYKLPFVWFTLILTAKI